MLRRCQDGVREGRFPGREIFNKELRMCVVVNIVLWISSGQKSLRILTLLHTGKYSSISACVRAFVSARRRDGSVVVMAVLHRGKYVPDDMSSRVGYANETFAFVQWYTQ